MSRSGIARWLQSRLGIVPPDAAETVCVFCGGTGRVVAVAPDGSPAGAAVRPTASVAAGSEEEPK